MINKDQSNVDCALSTVSSLSTLSIHKMKACNALNAMFVETVDTTVKTHPGHSLAITFLMFNGFSFRQKVLES